VDALEDEVALEELAGPLLDGAEEVEADELAALEEAAVELEGSEESTAELVAADEAGAELVAEDEGFLSAL
jgi:hypothetical protein